MYRFWVGICLYSVCIFTSAHSQEFTASGLGTPVDLTGANGSCASNGAISFDVNVSGVGTLSSTNALVNIHLTLNDCGTGSKNANLVYIYLKSPAGTCSQIYGGGLSTVFTGTYDFNLTSSSTCLNIPSTAGLPFATSSNLNADGTSGIFSVVGGGGPFDLTTFYNGNNADGTWKVIFFESTTSEPCIDSIQLTFGNPVVTNTTGQGDNCVNPIVWNGSPQCASTSGQTPSANMPGWNGSSFGNVGGTACNWNGANNNDTWVAFVANEPYVCVNLSGLDQSQQSIVVTDPNTDGDNNPCTGAGGGTYWQLVNCPNPASYTTTAGTVASQNHCFTANVGQTYYLVIDGNGGAESPFYVSGITGTVFNTLGVDIHSIEYGCTDKRPYLNWSVDNLDRYDYFEIQHSGDGINFETVHYISKQMSSDGYSFFMSLNQDKFSAGYARLKAVTTNSELEFSKVFHMDCSSEELMIHVVDNKLVFVNFTRVNNIKLVDLAGRLIYSGSPEGINLDELTSAVYLIEVDAIEGEKQFKIFIP